MAAADTTQERIAENVWTRLISRSAMMVTPVLIVFLGFVGDNYLNTQTARIEAIIAHQDEQDTQISALATRTTIIETDRTRAIADASQARQLILNKLDDLSRGQTDQLAKLAALTATVDALKERIVTRQLGLNDTPSR